jgi:hypothetical protein
MNAPLIADTIDLLFCPGGKPERALRRRIQRARDNAALKAEHTEHQDAYTIRCMARDFANRHALSPANLDDLCDVIRALSFLAMAASIVERMESAHA